MNLIKKFKKYRKFYLNNKNKLGKKQCEVSENETKDLPHIYSPDESFISTREQYLLLEKMRKSQN